MNFESAASQDESAETPQTYTVIEMHDGSFTHIPDDEVDARLAELNAHLTGTQKSATIYSKSGLTLEQVQETIDSVEGN